METFVTCFVLIVLLALLVPFILTFAHARKIKALEETVRKLVARIAELELRSSGTAATAAAAVAPIVEKPSAASEVAPPPRPESMVVPAPEALPAGRMSPALASILKTPAEPPPPGTPPPVATPPPLKPRPTPAPRAPIDWEAFLGVKLFAWVGGFVLFLGVVFLVKYSFENNLITPFMRVVLGALIGGFLIAAGWFTSRKNYRIPGQSLCATGVLVLYADTFGAHTFYHLISLPVAFALMSVITVAAFFLAVTMNAQVVVVLGLVGGFLTPLLLTTGNHPWPTFSYIALLNCGIAAVALRKRWDYLFFLGALGTVAIEGLWVPIHSVQQLRLGFPICLGLQALFLAFAYLRQRLQPEEKWSTPSAAIVGFASIGYVFILLSVPSLAQRPAFFFAFAFLADIGLLFLATMRPNPSRIAACAGSVIFALLATWTNDYLKHELLWWALGAYLLFALIHAGFSVWPSRPEEKTKPSAPWLRYVPLLALGLLFICVSHGEASFAVWACVLLVDVIAIAIALRSESIIALLVALLATLATAGLWIVTAPPLNESVIGILIVVGGFGVFFSTASTFLSRKLGIGTDDSRRNVPAIAAAMPFVLLLMLIAKLPIGAPTAVFAVALLLAVVLLGLGIVSRSSWIVAVALAFTWAVECEWHTIHFVNSHALLALGWYVLICLVFVAYPFFSAEERVLPWAIGALAGVFHFFLVYDAIQMAYPHLRNGLLPALFVLPFAFGVFFLIRKRGIAPASGDARLAWQGGAALFFVSLIFPIQFEREWITLGWALEGFALLALFRAVPNQGLRLVGAGLLSLSFVRLALNPAVLEYHRRSATRIWNWYLYAYGVSSLCLFGGARLTQPYRDTLLARIVPRLLYTLGAVLTFLLLNIEIADYFSVGPTLTFSFSGNFARDMTYSIAWALFAFTLLLVGMKKKTRFVRYAGLALLSVTLLKLFFHDLGQLGPLYRIGAFMAVALILIVASFVYQRFLRPKAEP